MSMEEKAINHVHIPELERLGELKGKAIANGDWRLAYGYVREEMYLIELCLKGNGLIAPEETFVVIKCGHEGIEDLCFASTDVIRAVSDLKARRMKISAAKEKYKGITGYYSDQDPDFDIDDYESSESRWREMQETHAIDFEEYIEGKFGDPDAFCLQKWDGKKFYCCCREYGISPSKNWLMA